LPDPYIKLVGNTLTIGARNEDGNIVYSEEFKVVGRVKSDNNIDYASDEGIIMNSTDLKAFMKNAGSATGTKSTNSYSSVKVYATDINSVSSLQEEINGMGYQTSSMQEMRESTQKETRTIQLALGGIGAISMLVAAIGIMNTMIMSVSERTKEIGIMKALGCYVTDIRKLFLLEAASIGFLGGFIGSILSCIVSLVINLIYAMMQGIDTSSFSTLVSGIMENRVSIIPIWLFLFGVAFSMIFGLVSGAYPAEKAVKISPLEAMKNE
jgi:ABC-type antimicrobial peptide transport system permease subunit